MPEDPFGGGQTLRASISSQEEKRGHASQGCKFGRKLLFGDLFASTHVLAKRTVKPQEWADAEENGFEQEIVDDYLNALSELLEIEMGESVYGMIEEDEGFLGQYEEGDEEELRLRFTIVDDLGHRLRPRDRRRSRKHWDPE